MCQGRRWAGMEVVGDYGGTGSVPRLARAWDSAGQTSAPHIGRDKVKVVPCPGELATAIAPPQPVTVL